MWILRLLSAIIRLVTEGVRRYDDDDEDDDDDDADADADGNEEKDDDDAVVGPRGQ